MAVLSEWFNKLSSIMKSVFVGGAMIVLLAFIALLCVLTPSSPDEDEIAGMLALTVASFTEVPAKEVVPSGPTQTLHIIVVTATSSPTPRFTSTITPTPSETPLPSSTPNATQTAKAQAEAHLTQSRGSGFYLVGVDIAPGVWRSQGSQDDCYWSVTRKNGDIIDNHFGMAGGTAYISASAFQVEFDDCGTWEFLSPP